MTDVDKLLAVGVITLLAVLILHIDAPDPRYDEGDVVTVRAVGSTDTDEGDGGGGGTSPGTGEWLREGTLHSATIGEWKNASYSNKLATAEDWLAATSWKGHLNSPADFARLKTKAAMLVRGVDTAISTADETAVEEGRPDVVGKMDSERVTPIATLLIRGSDEGDP